MINPVAKYRHVVWLAAAAAMLAAMITGCAPPDRGISHVWITEAGAIAGGHLYGAGNPEEATNWRGDHQSTDGGWNWTEGSNPADFHQTIEPNQSVATPWGDFEIDGTEVVRVDPAGQTGVAHSTAYLDKSANEWVQRQMTESLGDRVITTHPYSIVYDPKHDTVVVALGLQGVVVGTPDGDWLPVAVGPYSPTDFSVATRFGLLFSHPNLWISVVAVSVSVVAGTVALRRFRAEGGGRHQTPAFVFSAGVLTLSPVGMGIGSLLMVVVTGMVVSIYRFVAHRGTIRRFWEVVVLVIWTTVGSGLFVAILVYGFPVFIYASFGFGVYFWWWYAVAVAATAGAAGGLLWLWLGSRFWLALAALILAVVFGPYFGIFGIGAARHYSVGYTAFFMGPALSYAVLALALSWPMFRHWPVIIVAFLSINAVILGGVTLWMWNNVTLLPFQPLASGLTALIAWALWEIPACEATLSHQGRGGPSTGSGRTEVGGMDRILGRSRDRHCYGEMVLAMTGGFTVATVSSTGQAPALSHQGRGGPSTGSGRTEVGGMDRILGRSRDRHCYGEMVLAMTGGFTVATVSSTGQAPALSHQGRGGPSTGSGRTEVGGMDRILGRERQRHCYGDEIAALRSQ